MCKEEQQSKISKYFNHCFYCILEIFSFVDVGFRALMLFQ